MEEERDLMTRDKVCGMMGGIAWIGNDAMG
jgi:hypothetical protein